jgi:AcrR family transcriptional regulator
MQSTPRPARARKAPDDRRAEIAAAARAIALAEGLDAVTQRAVAARAAVTPALVAHYVENMDALVADTFSAVVADELTEVRRLLDTEPHVARRLAALLETLLDGSRNDVTPVWVQAWALGHRNELLANAVRRHMDDWQLLIRGVLEAGERAGTFHCAQPGETAWHVLAMIDGLNAHALVRWGAPAVQVSLAKRAVEPMVGLAAGALDAAAGTDRSTLFGLRRRPPRRRRST